MSNVPKMLQRNILEEAHELINGDRRKDYGEVSESFKKMATLASIFLKKDLTELDICWIMIAVKICRQLNQSKRDNLVDLAGYTGLMQQLLDGKEKENLNFEELAFQHHNRIRHSYEEELKNYLREKDLYQPKTGVMGKDENPS